ncbi:FadR/GntR family transcriptional regulator [Streptomyces sp. NPDC020883]|uniref:FadR/GntR family transcriptional regulator n=1 Tax=Streptomyces sp. NPDC020883 TaxID=3365099 RepID=UPI00379C7A62
MDHLMGKFKASRTILREALGILRGKGMIDAKPSVGTWVTENRDWRILDPDILSWRADGADGAAQAHDLAELGQAIDVEAARLAAVRGTDSTFTALQQALMCTRHRNAPQVNAPPTLQPSADRAFHRALFEGSGNQFFVYIGNLVASHFDPGRFCYGSARHHELLLYALQRRDAKAAGEVATHLHIEDPRMKNDDLPA